MRILLLTAAVALWATSSLADLVKVEDQEDFVELIAGKTLTRPLIKLTVSPDGRIEGRGLRWDVKGSWSWQNGYFCRDLFWGGDALGYNCQEVRMNGVRIQFTSDRGAGDSATFRLR